MVIEFYALELGLEFIVNVVLGLYFGIRVQWLELCCSWVRFMRFCLKNYGYGLLFRIGV